MTNAINLYFRYIGVSFRSQMQYRASFVMQTTGQFFVGALDFVSIWILFDRFGTLKGWTLPEVALFYGIISVAFATSDAMSRGFDAFGRMVKSGDFDRILVRPRSTVLQLAGEELTLKRIGRLLQGLAVLLWAAHALDVQWSLLRIMLTIGAIIGGACLFYGILVVQATIAFWTVESLEVMNTLTYGGKETGMYPLVIYRKWFRRFFTFIVPLACVNYYPTLAVLGRADPLGTSVYFQCVAPIMGVLFLAGALQFWKVGVRHYRSTGS